LSSGAQQHLVEKTSMQADEMN